MKIAFMYSGFIRNLKELADQHKKIIEDLNADVFASFWETTDSLDKCDSVSYFCDRLNPVAVEIEDLHSWKESVCFEETMKDIKVDLSFFGSEWINQCADFKSLSMWYKIWRANFLRCQSKKEYDIVVRLRTDLNFTRGFLPQKNEYINIPSGIVFIDGMEHVFGPHDILAYGSPPLMNYYCSLYQNVNHYIMNNEFVLQPENLLRVHLSQKDLTVRMWEDDIKLGSRIDGNVDRGFNHFFHNSSSWKR